MLESKYNVGTRDRRIVIQNPITVKNDYNEDEETWETFATVWAAVADATGSESYQAEQKTANRITEFNIRYLSDMSETMRILYDERFYGIVSIQRPDRRRSLILKAEILDET